MRSYIKAVSVPLRSLQRRQQRSHFVVRQPRCLVRLQSGFKSKTKIIIDQRTKNPTLGKKEHYSRIKLRSGSDILTGAILLKLTAIALATVRSEGERYQERIRFLRRFFGCSLKKSNSPYSELILRISLVLSCNGKRLTVFWL
ncbi:hypothetical protein F2Q69_00015249 [Brassica cretica]|uniref:Uncharacterized protein n=1 Tax=Brassica cretica TaxID=69181 RepID=A0A8S9QUC7_BRACR|nr:hypothetical protein F2Q69_00015249 [Brassica cretica]